MRCQRDDAVRCVRQLAGPLAIGLLSVAHPAAAQSQLPAGRPGAEKVGVVEELIVTAQRRAERLQDVPIAITALTGPVLEAKGVTNVADLQGMVPSLSISAWAGQASTNLLSLRGVAGQSLPIGASQATAIYLDGVYLSKPDAAFFGLDDIERIEVLRGPQGTLYGRNATAGAVNIITHAPDDDFRARMSVNYGSYNAVESRGSVSIPISDSVALGLSGSTENRDGYFRNTVTGDQIGDRSSYTGRAKLRVHPSSSFDVTFSADYTTIKQPEFYTTVTAPNGSPVFPSKYLSTNIEPDVTTRVKTGGVAMSIDYSISPALSVSSITSFRKFYYFTNYDLDATSAAIATVTAWNENETFNQEIRGTYNGERARLTLGVNYYQERGDYALAVNLPVLTEDMVKAHAAPRDTTELTAMAVFGQGELDIGKSLTAVVGLRLNRERRDFTIDYSATGTFPPTRGAIKDTVLLPSFGLNYKVSDAALLYVKASLGYQAPGFNYLPGATAPVNTFRAEKLWAYELGLKSQFFDRRLTFNAAAFLYDYSDIQVRSLLSISVAQIGNLASATVKGLEGELTVEAAPGLTFNAHGTYLEATYDSFCEPLAPNIPQNGAPLCPGAIAPSANRSGFFLNQAPKWSGGIGATYRGSIGGHDVNLSAKWASESNSFYTAPNEAAVASGGWQRVDVRAAVDLTRHIELYVFGDNLTDDRFLGYAGRRSPTATVGTVSAPRTYGVGAKFTY